MTRILPLPIEGEGGAPTLAQQVCTGAPGEGAFPYAEITQTALRRVDEAAHLPVPQPRIGAAFRQ